jgi:hypothetical protein
MKAKLIEDIISYNYKVRGKKEEEITIISKFEDIYIVENREGERYSVHKTKLKLND